MWPSIPPPREVLPFCAERYQSSMFRKFSIPLILRRRMLQPLESNVNLSVVDQSQCHYGIRLCSMYADLGFSFRELGASHAALSTIPKIAETVLRRRPMLCPRLSLIATAPTAPTREPTHTRITSSLVECCSALVKPTRFLSRVVQAITNCTVSLRLVTCMLGPVFD